MAFISFNKYNKNQLILSSDRIIINAKDDNIFLLSNKDLSISAGDSVHINIGKKSGDNSKSVFILNSPKIQFGIPDQNNTLEPVAKADKSVQLMNELLSGLNDFMNQLSSANGVVSGGIANLPSINIASKAMIEKIKNISKQVNDIKSKKTFTV